LVADLPSNILYDWGSDKTWDRAVEIASKQMFKQYI